MGVGLLFTGLNLFKLFTGQSQIKLIEIPLIKLENTFLLTGNLIYAFELCSCYLSLRLTSQESVNYEGLTKKMMVFITITYIVTGGTYSLVYRPINIHENAFEIYKAGLL